MRGAGGWAASPVPPSETPIDTNLVERAGRIHASVLTIDTHDDIPLDFATPDADPGMRGDRQVDLPKMEEGGLDAGFFVVYVGQTERTPENYAQAQADALTKFEAIHRMAETQYPDRTHPAGHLGREPRHRRTVPAAGHARHLRTRHGRHRHL